MKLLLDTHAALWWLGADPRLTEDVRHHLAAASSEVLLSAAVVWEIAIKRSLGKLAASERTVELLLEGGARPLSVTLEHAVAVEALPWHHRDPFDRILVAQAIVERAAVVSADAALRAYRVPLVW